MKISMKKRKIGYTYGSVSGHYSFRKEKSIAFESTLERDLLALLEFNSSVEDVVGQPITIEYENHNGRSVTYTPDFLIFFKEPNAELERVQRKPLLIEVKPREKLKKNWCNLRNKYKIAVQYARENDMLFKIYDERRIRTQYLKNINFLKRYSRYEYPQEDEDNILAYSNSVGNTSIEHILEYLCISKDQKGVMLGHIWKLIFNKKLLCPLGDELNQQIEVWIDESIDVGELQ